MAALVGTRLGPYEIVAPLGAGGMGAVYRGRDTRLERDVAVKVLPPHLIDSSDALVRFEREARAVAALSHPNILALHDVGRDGSVTYAVTELLEGETLREAIADGPMPPRRALDVLAQIARGLGAAHERGIVHRDIKPENLFLTRDGRVKILDFGIATHVDSSATTALSTPQLTQPGTVIGTPTYMAPEQLAAAPATARSDLFAFGLVAHELLTGSHPFRRSTVNEMMAAILRDDPAALGRVAASLPLGVARLLARCLEKAPSDRPESARDLAFYLDAMSTAPDMLTDGALEAQPRVARLLKRRVFAASVATALLIVALTWGYAGWMAQRVASGALTTDVDRAQQLVLRVQNERLSHLALTADLMASFPASQALFERTDGATIRDFLITHQALVPGTPQLAALLPDGRVLARTDSASPAPPARGDTWIDTLVTKNGGPAVVTIDGRLHHGASAASDAGGNIFGYVVAALPVDQEFARTLSDATQGEVVLLADGVVASTLRASETPWRSLQDWRAAGGRTDRTTEVEIGARRYDAQEITLSAQPPLAAIVARSRDDAAAPFRRIQNGLVLIGLIGIALAVGGAYWIARGATNAIAKPH
jgi:protein kinase-like protein